MSSIEDKSIEDVCNWLRENTDVPESVLDDFRGRPKVLTHTVSRARRRVFAVDVARVSARTLSINLLLCSVFPFQMKTWTGKLLLPDSRHVPVQTG